MILKMFCEDIPVSTTSFLVGVNKNITQYIYSKLRLRIVDIASKESEKLTTLNHTRCGIYVWNSTS